MMKDSAAEFVMASKVAFIESEDNYITSINKVKKFTYHILLLNYID